MLLKVGSVDCIIDDVGFGLVSDDCVYDFGVGVF